MNLSEHDKAVLEAIFDPLQLASFDPVDDTNEKNSLDDPNEVIEDPGVVELWKKAVSTAESGKIDEALDYFQQVREKAPNVLSVLNDRAQALRLAGRTEEALKDLDELIESTKNHGKIVTKALCQRGLIHRLLGNENQSKIDFETAAKNGSIFARKQIVHLNPYAAMCNAMLHEINSKSLISEKKKFE